MLSSRVPWETKLRPGQRPAVVAAPRGAGRMLVPTPMLVAEEIRKVRSGRLLKVPALRARLARRFEVEVTCPLTTGIFLSIISVASEERMARKRRPVAPWWRVIGERGELNPKWPPGIVRQAQLLRAEGHRVVRAARGTGLRVMLPGPRATK